MGMTLINDSGVQAHLFRMQLEEEKMLGIAVAKTTIKVAPDGRLDYDMDEAIEVFDKPEDSPLGTFPPDSAIRKDKVDLFVMGHARSPQPVQACQVTLAVGDFHRSVQVFGRRAWVPTGRSYRASAPVPFTEMPLTWEYAYGGLASVREGEEVPNMDNQLGRGYILDPSRAEGVELPCLEDPDCLIQRVEDQPRPICFAPLAMGSWLQAENTYRERPDTLETEPLPSMFNFAHPKHRIDALHPGALISLTGATLEPFRFVMPNLNIMAEVTLENRRYEFNGVIDGLYLFPDTRRALIVHRVSFTYSYIREEIRRTRLVFRH